MYEDLDPSEALLIIIDFVLRGVEIPAALKALVSDEDLEAIQNPESINA